jgi:hypothetical protein
MRKIFSVLLSTCALLFCAIDTSFALPLCSGDYDRYSWSGCTGTVSKRGVTYSGAFKNGMFHGEGTVEQSNGSKFIGEFRYGKQHGKGVLTTSKGVVLRGYWINGFYKGKY